MSVGPDGDFGEFVQTVLDEQIADIRKQVAAGRVLTQEEVLSLLDQLAQDRARMNGLKQRIGAVIQ